MNSNVFFSAVEIIYVGFVHDRAELKRHLSLFQMYDYDQYYYHTNPSLL